MRKTIRIDHLARVEGHGGVTVELDGDAVSDVRFDVFEGARLVEALVRGRNHQDVSQILSRICAICSVAHSLTSIKATENAFGVEVTPQTTLLRELMYLGESIESHALHVFCLALPDYLNYPSVAAMAADHPDAVKMGLRLKKLGNSIQEAIGGRAVHPVNAVVGGFGRVPNVDQMIALRQDLLAAVADCPAVIDLVASLPDASYCHSETVFAALRLPEHYGYYLGDDVTVAVNGSRTMVPAVDYRSLTNEQAMPHSHAKHSTFHGRPFMVGALARLTANREQLDDSTKDLVEKVGLNLPSDNPMDNNKAQAVELVADIHQALEIVEKLLHDGVEDQPLAEVRPRAATGTAVTEAPRGLLFHSYAYDEEGTVVSADVITPTALNAASIEDHLRHAVAQSAVKDESLEKKLEMIVRAYDPCISCSVHLVRKRPHNVDRPLIP